VTSNVLQSFKVRCQWSRSQHHKTSSDRQTIVSFEEIGVAKANGDFRILIRSWEIAVGVHAQYKIDQNSPEQLSRRRVVSVAMLSQLSPSLVPYRVFSERELMFMLAICRRIRPSVCLSVCLSSVTFVHPT